MVQAMWLMMQQPKPDDFVISTGVAHTVREFATAAFKRAGVEIVYVIAVRLHLLAYCCANLCIMAGFYQVDCITCML